MAMNNRIDPLNDDDSAAELIRKKLDQIYEEEPDAEQEIVESEAAPHRSKHQQFMYELGQSGKDLATIQTEWHNYYQGLSATEKHKVWQEFYSSQPILAQPAVADQPQKMAEHKHQAAKPKKLREARSKDEIKATIRHRVTAGGKLEAKHHLQSLFFGLGMGLIAVLIFLFGFFNEVILAPFIQPSRASASTPLIVSSDSVAPSESPEIIIPKINVQIPVDYSQTTTDESVIENALENGIVHYPTTNRPGENGNAAFFGHSSNNIFNRGKYKFAFVMLRTLVENDTFYLTYNKKVYVYKVISKRVVPPTEVSVLNPVPGQTATATLITCDPPGTSLNRLVIVGQQVSPDPAGNTTSNGQTVTAATNTPDDLPGNGPTLLGRVFRSGLGKVALLLAAVGAGWVSVRWTNQQIAYLKS